jgi:hypothetical protein
MGLAGAREKIPRTGSSLEKTKGHLRLPPEAMARSNDAGGPMSRARPSFYCEVALAVRLSESCPDFAPMVRG